MGNKAVKPEDAKASRRAATGEKRPFNKVYNLGRELGKGAFSVVRLGTNKSTNQEVAVKIISKKKMSPEDTKALWNEIEILDSLDHPNILSLIEVFEEGSDFYVVTELLEGGELFDRIVHKTYYTEKECRDLIKVLLETLNYLHGNNIVHRDLKPENLLLTSTNDDTDVKIADFGFAKRITDLGAREVACGTPGYVAPEILRGDPYGPEVDVWSLGVIIYVLLVGYPPFYDDDQRKLFKKIKEARYYFHEDYWSGISEDAIDLIRKMLTLDQKERWTAAQLLQHAWITAKDEDLAARDISGAITEMKRFNALRKFRAAGNMIMSINRMKRLGFGRRSMKAEGAAPDAVAEGDDSTPPAVAAASAMESDSASAAAVTTSTDGAEAVTTAT